MDSISDLDLSKTYTYADYYSWRFEERVELIRGRGFEMINYPGATCMGTDHQTISGNIAAVIWGFLKKKRTGDVFVAPFDVRLVDKSRYDQDVSNVVQPDISVFLDRTKLDQRGGIGTPDIVIEILIAGNNLIELKEKFQLYEDFGLAEYWVVFIEKQSVMRYVMNEKGKFESEGDSLNKGDIITTPILPGFELALDDVFSGLLEN